MKPPAPAFDPPGRVYNYAPALVQDRDAGTRYAFYCANREPGRVTDHLCFRKATLRNGAWSWGAERVALSPGAARTDWDSRHVCDPDALAGRFRFGGQSYTFALFYLGTDSEGSTHNQVGVAFSHALEGPWVKYPRPLVGYSADPGGGPIGARDGRPVWRWWGVGQPAAVSLDGAGKALLFFSRGEGEHGAEMVTADLSNMDAGPRLRERRRVPTDGLTRADGRPAGYVTNLSIAHDARRDRYWMVREGDLPAGDGRFPGFVSSFAQVAWMDGPALRAGRGTWRVAANLDAARTGRPRNHNAGLLRDLRGRLPDPDRLTVGVSVADAYDHPPADSAWLWTYRIVLLDLSAE